MTAPRAWRGAVNGSRASRGEALCAPTAALSGRPCERAGQAFRRRRSPLPFPDATFDVVASALVINFIPDRPRALAEMRRVARVGSMVAGYVWDFAMESSPSGPLRRGMRQFGIDVPVLPGAIESTTAAMASLFALAGFESIATRSIDATLPYTDFDDFWQAQTPDYSPTTKIIAAMSDGERTRLMAAVRAELPTRPDGSIAYAARANAINARVPG
jgi:SAM-dependent methyltransferase